MHLAILCLLAIAYLLAYFAHPALPGNSLEQPLGWWTWFDQGEYIKAARALRAGNLASENYFYPPVYPMLGALFVGLNPMHPFLLVNLASFVIFAHFFIALARRHIGWSAAVVAFALSFSDKILVAVWVEPWTTTVVTAIYAFLFWAFDRLLSNTDRPSTIRLAILGGLGGLVFSTRPADAVALSPLFLCIIWFMAPPHRPASFATPWNRYCRNVVAMVLMGLAASALFIIFNILVHHSVGGRYFSVSTQSNGFHFADIFEKAVSIFLDAGSLYNAPDDSVLHRIKWLALAVPSAIYVIFFAPIVLRIVLAVIVLQLALYLPYADLLPTGVWRYQNIHYFKWLLPYLVLLVFWTARDFVLNWEKGSARKIVLAGAIVLGLVVLATRIQLVEVEGGRLEACPGQGSSCLIFGFAEGEPVEIDKISFPTLNGDFRTVYFSSNARVASDGRELTHIRDFRFLPAEQGVDLLFIRPVRAREVHINTGAMSFDQSEVVPRVYRYRFALGPPAWVVKTGSPPAGPSAVRYQSTLAQGIDFRREGFPHFVSAVSGISAVEQWGRWSETDEKGRVQFKFNEALPENFVLELTVSAYGPNVGKPVRVKVGDDEKTFVVAGGQGVEVQKVEFRGVRDKRELEIVVPQPVRPKDLPGGSDDARRLGLGFVSLRIVSL
jgi:hypothetical protein